MKRRTVLQAIGLTGVSGMAGCLRLQSGDESTTGTTTSPNPATQRGTEEPTPVDRETERPDIGDGGDTDGFGASTPTESDTVEPTETADDSTGVSLPSRECSAPSGNIEAALPDGGEFQQLREPNTNNNPDDENVERAVFTAYTGQDGGQFAFTITEFVSETAASEALRNADPEQSQTDQETGFVLAGRYIYLAFGPTRDDVMRLLAASEALDATCVQAAVEFF